MARARGIHLQRRDLAILEALAARRVDTLEDLHHRHFAGLTRKRAVNRLGELTSHGYLRRIALDGPDGATCNVYAPGPKAPAALRLRSLAGEQRGAARVAVTSIPHQLAVNRVGDALGTALIGEHLLGGPRGDRRHRPDGAYRCAPDAQGRDLVFVEADLGHYSRARVVGKVAAFLAHPEARSILFATPNPERARQVGAWIRLAYGDAVMGRIQLLTLDELDAGARLDAGTEPATPLSAARAAA